MVASINSLANMEYMLYGGTLGANMNCPSMANGYRAGVNFYGNYYNPYYAQAYNQNYSNNYNNSIYDAYTPSANTQASGQLGFGASKSDLDVLGRYYMKGLNPSESLGGAALGGAAFGMMTNLRFFAHPWNSLSTIGKVEKTFADVKKEGTKLYELWRNPETHKIMTDAYARMHKLEGAAKSRLGMFKSQLDKGVYDSLKAEMESALRSGDKNKIATATEKIRVATDAKTGRLANGWKKLWGGKPTNVSELVKDKTAIKAAVEKNVAEKGAKTLSEQFKHSLKGQGGIGGALMFGVEYLMDMGKIKSAFSKDSETGWKQVGQTTVKGAGSLIGWTVGEAAGAWAGAKLGALAGSAIAPGVGTVIGAVAGLIGGSIGCALAGKFTKKLVGEDVGTKVEVENMKKTAQGQVQLLQLTAQQAQGDKKLDPKVARALQNVFSQYSTVA